MADVQYPNRLPPFINLKENAVGVPSSSVVKVADIAACLRASGASGHLPGFSASE
jgi:hypothetical protein